MMLAIQPSIIITKTRKYTMITITRIHHVFAVSTDPLAIIIMIAITPTVIGTIMTHGFTG